MVLFWLFVIAVAVQIGYAFYFFTRIFTLAGKRAAGAAHPVSVVICARNEARNLELHLPSVLGQRYMNEAGKPMYEVIVVNDASEDDSEQVLYRLEQQYSHLWHVTIPKKEPRTFKGKKFALSYGVRYATYPWLLLMDADCMPASEDWICHMTQPLEQGRELVAGYGAYRHKPGLLNAFVRWETMHTFLQYSTYALSGRPYMAVGRNLATTKELYLKAEQSPLWNETASGDDDLLVQAAGTADNTAIVAHRDAFTISEPPWNWRQWLRQKRRHMSTGKLYSDETKALLGVYAVSHMLVWVLFFVLLCFPGWTMALFIMAMRCAMYWTIWQSTAFRLQDRKLFQWIPLCDIGWVVYNLVLSPWIIWKSKQQWK